MGLLKKLSPVNRIKKTFDVAKKAIDKIKDVQDKKKDFYKGIKDRKVKDAKRFNKWSKDKKFWRFVEPSIGGAELGLKTSKKGFGKIGETFAPKQNIYQPDVTAIPDQEELEKQARRRRAGQRGSRSASTLTSGDQPLG